MESTQNIPSHASAAMPTWSTKADDYLEKESNYTVRAGASRGAAYDSLCPQWGQGL